MKRILSLLLVALVLIGTVPFISHGAASSHLIDSAGLLNDDEVYQIESKLAEVSTETGVEVLLRVTESLNGTDVGFYAKASMEAEFGDVSDCVLFILITETRTWYMDSKGTGSLYFPEDVCDSVAETFLPELSSGDYLAGFLHYGDEVLNTVQNTDITTVNNRSVILGSVYPHIIDGAALLTDEEAKTVEEKLAEVSEEIGMHVLVRTTDSLGGDYPMVFADDAMDYEYGDVKDGILFLISMEERDWYVSTKGTGIDVFNDDVIDTIVDSFLSEISDGNYAEGFISYAKATLKQYRYQTSTFHFDVMSVGVPLAVALLISWIIVSMMKGQLKSVRFQNASQYLKQGSFVLTQNVDLFLFTNVTKTRIERESSSGGGGTHTSSSGSSHGGHGGKF